jgi:hypothetical protein
VVLWIGVLEWVAGLGVFVENKFWRCVGVILPTVNVIVQPLMIPAHPF